MSATRLIITAVGGQGNLLSSIVLGEAALLSDIPVRMSEIHGVAQRGGVVEADLLVGFKPSETLEHCTSVIMQIQSSLLTLLLCHQLLPIFGKSVYPDLKELQNLISAKTARLIAFDAVELAKEAGNVMSVNMVLLGSLIQTGVLPISADNIKTAIKTRTKKAFLDINLKAFDLGFSAAGKSG